MSDNPSLDAIFTLDGVALRPSAILASDAFAAIKAASAVPKAIVSALRDALHVPLTTVIAGAWNTYRPFLKFRDPARYPPDTSTVVPLLPHTITSTHEPVVDILLDGKRIGTIRFEVELSLTFDGAAVTVRDGRFMSLSTGTCTVAGVLSCQGATLIDHTSRDFRMPGTLSFGDGFPIGPHHRPDTEVPEEPAHDVDTTRAAPSPPSSDLLRGAGRNRTGE